MSPLEQVTVVMTLMLQLQNLLDEETEYLRAMKIERLEALQNEKVALAEAYEIEMYRLRKEPEVLGALPIEVRQSFEDAVRTLQSASRRNAHAVEAARTVVDRIVRRLGRTLEQRRNRPSGYDSDSRGRVISVAFNHRI
ncbi:MAG: hypothetical protein H6851_15945 [Geminicoccaceae bacterium]|nr:hypothetical protein [Geminicoccaceae bacterium]MCB9945098.1 hypothetical protein [Geminicoccaceae bacterium]